MTETATPKVAKVAAPKKVSEHPTYAVMVAAALASLKDRKGSSKQAIEKYVCANYKVGVKYNGPLKLALRKGVESGVLIQTKGQGASGSFKIAKVEKPAAKKPAVKKPVAKKAVAKKAPPKKPLTQEYKRKAKKLAAIAAAKSPNTAKPPKKVTKKVKKTVKKPLVKKVTKAKK